MPYEWVTPSDGAPERSGAPSHDNPQDVPAGPPAAELHLWPYRSLPRRGFVAFIALTAAFLAVPLLAVVGSPILWGLLPFILAAIAAIWWALSRSYRDGEVLEVLRLWPDRVVLSHQRRGGSLKRWAANPYWVRVILHAEGGPVPSYLTLKGGDREVEIGAFLSEDERKALKQELVDALVRVAR